MNERMTDMIRLECDRCGMSATAVDTPDLHRAWSDHMNVHGDDLKAYRCWTWSVVRLFP